MSKDGTYAPNITFMAPINQVQQAHTIVSTTTIHSNTVNNETSSPSESVLAAQDENQRGGAEENQEVLRPQEIQRQKEYDSILHWLSEPKGFLHNMREGYVFVINNEKFNDADSRIGSSNDVEALKTFFQHTLSWENFYVQNDLTKNEMEAKIKDISEKDFSKFSAFFLIILSHGCKDGIYGVDKQVMVVEPLLHYFAADVCKTLANKPKVFILQACRGNLDDEGYSLNETDAIVTSESRMINIPTLSDFLIAYPCNPSYTALRDQKSGTQFIQALVHTLQRFHNQEHLMDIFLRVNWLISRTNNQLAIKSMPCIDVRFGKKWYFYTYFISVSKKMKEMNITVEN